jgi:hypothetical protein
MIQKSGSEAVVQTSLGLDALCRKLEGVTSFDVLELGPARSANIEFWFRYKSPIFVADLRSSLPLPYLAEEQQFPESEWERILGLPEGRLYDVILAWDLLNYIDLPVLPSFINYIIRFCRPGAILFFLIFDQPQMPAEITIYKIMDERRVAYEQNGGNTRSCPRHQPRALTRLLCHFQTSDSFRLKNGIVEYLFTYEK